MFPFKSVWARIALIIPAVIIAYFTFLYIGGLNDKNEIDLLGVGAAQESDAQQQRRSGPVSAEMADALREKAEELDKREEEIERKEQELAVFERDLLRMRQEIAKERAELDRAISDYQQQETDRTSQRINLIAQTFKNTKDTIAAAQLEALYEKNRVTALYVLSQLDSRSAGKIFSKFVNAELAAQILEDFKTWQVAEGEEDSSIVSR